MPRTLALDIGNRRIGVAITDELNLLAHPLLTIHRTTLRADLRSIGRLVRKHAITTIVIGLPLHASGDDSAQAAKTRTFAQSLMDHLATTLSSRPESQSHRDAAERPAVDAPQIVFLDERHTTAEAHALLDTLHGPRRTAADREQRTNIIDQAAATLILTAWLETQHGPTLLPQD